VLLLTRDLPRCRVRSTCESLPSTVPLAARNARFVEESRLSHLKYNLDPSAWLLPGEFTAMMNCVRCNGGLATISGEIHVRIITLLSPVGRAQRPVCGEKVGQTTRNTTSIQRCRCFQVSSPRSRTVFVVTGYLRSCRVRSVCESSPF
jgi:hypothetical protein